MGVMIIDSLNEKYESSGYGGKDKVSDYYEKICTDVLEIQDSSERCGGSSGRSLD